MGSVSKVPMHPRRERVELRPEMVFQVIKSGDSEMSEARWEVRRPMPMGVNEPVELAGVVSAVLGSREVELLDEGVEEPEFEVEVERLVRRCRVGFLRAGRDFFVDGSEEVEGPSWSSSSSSEAEPDSRPLG